LPLLSFGYIRYIITIDLRIKITFLLVIVLLSCDVYGQNFGFAKKLGGPKDDMGYSIITDTDGNIYTTGSFEETADFDPGNGIFNLNSFGWSDIFISKLDSSGNFLWAKSIGSKKGNDRGCSIALDSKGNVYITGQFGDTMDFDPGSGTFYLPGYSESLFILKLDSSGNFVWAKAVVSIGYMDVKSMVIDKKGNIYTTGSFSHTVDFDPGPGVYNLGINTGYYYLYVLKLDSLGKFVWAKGMIGDTWTGGNSIAVDNTGNVFILGLLTGTADFDPGIGTYNLTAIGLMDLVIVKLDSSGNLVWAESTGGTTWVSGSAIVIDSKGNFNITGYFYGTVDFDPGNGVCNLVAAGNNGSRDMFVLKLNIYGQFLWVKGIGSDGYEYGTSLVLDSFGNIYCTGNFQRKVDFDPSAGVYNLTSTSNGMDVYILKLDPCGNFISAGSMGSPSDDWALSIALGATGNIYLSGWFSGTGDFDPGAGTFNLTSPGGYKDVFLVKFFPDLSTSSQTLSGPISVCSGAKEKYQVSSSPGTNGYIWTVPAGAIINSGQNTTSVNVTFGTVSGNLRVTRINSCGDSVQTSLIIKVNPLPAVRALVFPSDTVCEGSSITLNGSGAFKYTWSGGIIDGVPFVPFIAATYLLTGTDSSGCSNIDSIRINIIPNPKKITQRLYYKCAHDSVRITANNNGMKYLWNTNDTTQQINVSLPGNYSVRITNQQCFVYDTVEVNNFLVVKPGISIWNNQLKSTTANSYQWYYSDSLLPGENNQYYIPGHNGFYKVLITDTNGCKTISDSLYFYSFYNELKIYPNPSGSKFTIEIPDNSPLKSIFIYDVISKGLPLSYTYNQGKVELNLEDFASGAYILLIEDIIGRQWVRKILKE